MMTKEFDIQDYMTRGVERVVADAVRATLKNPKESAYMARFAMSSKNASAKRKKMEKNGDHVPPFLITSITSSCNLHCAGCYSRCNSATEDSEPVDQATEVPCQMEGCLKLEQEELQILKELLDKAIIRMEA